MTDVNLKASFTWRKCRQVYAEFQIDMKVLTVTTVQFSFFNKLFFFFLLLQSIYSQSNNVYSRFLG
jgi:hypothetical protein